MVNGGVAGPPPDLLIDDCETAWTSTTGLLRTINATPTAGGSGYTAGDILDVTTGGAGGKVQVSTVDGGGAVTAITRYAGGLGGYTTGTGKATSGGTGTGCTIEITQVTTGSLTRSTTKHSGTYSCGCTTALTSSPSRSLRGYRTLPAPLDLSPYTTVRFWFRTVLDRVFSADAMRLALCSDAFGIDVVDVIQFPALVGTGAFEQFDEVRLGGGYLGANIQSIALYLGEADVPASASTSFLDEIRAIL